MVVRSTGSWYEVLHEGERLQCRIRGKLRLKGVRSTNPVVVGDVVRVEADAEGAYVISAIEPRCSLSFLTAPCSTTPPKSCTS